MGKDFAVQLDICGLEFTDKRAIGKATRFYCFGDTGDPEPSEVAFPVFSARIGVFSGVQIRFFGYPNVAAFGHPIAFVGLEDFFVFCMTDDSSFDSHISQIWQIGLI